MFEMTAEDFRTTFVFQPPTEGSWGISLEGFSDELRRRDSEAFTRYWDSMTGGQFLAFGFNDSEGMVKADPDNAALEECTVGEAADFAIWLSRQVVPATLDIEINTEQGVEWNLPWRPLPRSSKNDMRAALLACAQATLDASAS